MVRSDRKPETLFQGNVAWAFRTSIAAALGFLVVPSPQSIFVLPFFADVISIACCQKTIGQTIIYSIDTIKGAVLGSCLACLGAYILLQEPTFTYEVALPFVIFFCILILSHPIVPAKPFAFTLVFLGLGVPLGSSTQWYFGFQLLGTTVIGIVGAVVANLLPLLHPRAGYRQTTALLVEAETLTQSLMLQFVSVIQTNDTLEVASVVRACRHLTAVIAELEALSEATRLEMRICRCRRRGAEYERRVRLLMSQRVWLDGMRQSVEQRQGEPIFPDQQRFIDRCIPAYLALFTALGDTMVHPQAPINTQRILALLDGALAAFLQARIEVFYNPMFENGKPVLPILIHSLRRGAFVFHMSRLAEGITQAHVVAPLTKKQSNFSLKFDYKHPIKMALALAIASIWFIVPELRGLGLGRGVWIGITICFLSSADFGSSVTKSMDRLQGSLLACAFSVITIRIVGSNMAAAAVLMCAWVFATSFFRGGKEHGYAAVVAAFTSPVLLFGGVQFIGSYAMETFILARVEMTAIGVGVYLLIQAFIWPVDPVHEIEVETARWFTLAAKFATAVTSVTNPDSRGSSLKRSSTNLQSLETQPLASPVVVTGDLVQIKQARKLCEASWAKAKATVYAAAASPMPHRRPFAHVAYLNLLEKQGQCVVHMAQIAEALSHLGSSDGAEDQTVLQVVHDCITQVASQLTVAGTLMHSIKHSEGWEPKVNEDIAKTSVAFRQFGLLQSRVVHLWGEFLHDRFLRRNPTLSMHTGQLNPLGPDPFQDESKIDFELRIISPRANVLETNPVDCAKLYEAGSAFRLHPLDARLLSQQRLIASSAIIAGLSEFCATLARAGADIEAIYF